MASDAETIKARLRELQAQYTLSLPEKIQKIEADWEHNLANPNDREHLNTIIQDAHKLVGSGASFGYQTLSETARELEHYLRPFVEQQQTLQLEQQNHISQLVQQLYQASLKPSDASLAELPQHSDTGINARNKRPVLLLEDNDNYAQGLALQIGYFGYHVQQCPNLPALSKALDNTDPTAIIIDMRFCDTLQATDPALTEYISNKMIPLIFTSDKTECEIRLEAVRAGGIAFFSRPVDISALVDKLDQLTRQNEEEPYRVLIVEDSASLANYYSLLLQGSGMLSQAVTDPMEIMDAINEFHPDLLLVDMYMPDCNGMELAAVIRQHEAYVGLPIAYLSSETDMDKQLTAMSLGGDDFLTKPILPAHLVRAVTTRAKRYRVLRSLMIRDSLTGLLNHSAIKERLLSEVSRAKRHKQPLTFAMIDIDHFKLVNDNYGHSTGDRIIKSLSRLLRQRLRSSDIIGRYGGEEFAIILPSTELNAAQRVLNEIREGFAQIEQKAEGGATFRSTFSCGVAPLENYHTADTLSEAADKALYLAKQSGRNQVISAAG